MAKIKLTKSLIDAAQAKTCDVELRDTLVPGFLCKITPAGRKVFMLQYRTNSGVRRKPALGQFGELTVDQARSLAQDWLADVRHGGDPGHDKTEARRAPTVKELCVRFMEDHSKVRNKPSTQQSYQYQIDSHILPAFGSKKAHEVTRLDMIALMKRMEKSPTQANRVLACLRKMFNLAEFWGYRSDGSNPCRHVPKLPEKGSTRLITDEQMVKLFAYLDKAE
ncbi:MAG: integrase arm-type DNA-binding domain-containing protein, partial [Hydrogenophaga sp.]|uniref:integrase arm-type DNA-binding domain-containing protein n=1 Tax=Hydrogenophaga sp. TaxID=1904254 RepID=UPI003D0EEF37